MSSAEITAWSFRPFIEQSAFSCLARSFQIFLRGVLSLYHTFTLTYWIILLVFAPFPVFLNGLHPFSGLVIEDRLIELKFSVLSSCFLQTQTCVLNPWTCPLCFLYFCNIVILVILKF